MSLETNEDSAEEQEAQDSSNSEYRRLWESTWEATNEPDGIIPKGLHPDTEFDSKIWLDYIRKWRRFWKIGLGDLSKQIYPLVWCRIYFSVVTLDSKTVFVNYSFENLYDGLLEMDGEEHLFFMLRKGVQRTWLIEDVTTGERHDRTLPITGVHYIPRAINTKDESFMAMSRFDVATFTSKIYRGEDGQWHDDHPHRIVPIRNCVPNHTYKMQFIYGGLPSNVFVWTAPDL